MDSYFNYSKAFHTNTVRLMKRSLDVLKLSKIVAISSALAFVVTMSAAAIAAPTPVDQTVGQLNILSGNGGGGLEYADAQDNAFQYASGNIGANIAAGNSNQQANSSFIDGPSAPTYSYHGNFTQATLGAASVFSGLNYAAAKDNAFQHASGNVGANIAGGDQNMQNNALAVLENAADVHSNTTQANAFTVSFASGLNTGYIEDNAFQYASGNIGANVASGSMNQQSNSAVVEKLSSTQDSDLNTVDTTIGQISAVSLNILSGGNEAEVRDNAFQHASGNIGANLASGIGNQQANVLVVEP